MLVTTLISVKHKAGQLLFTIGQFVDEMKCETLFLILFFLLFQKSLLLNFVPPNQREKCDLILRSSF